METEHGFPEIDKGLDRDISRAKELKEHNHLYYVDPQNFTIHKVRPYIEDSQKETFMFHEHFGSLPHLEDQSIKVDKELWFENLAEALEKVDDLRRKQMADLKTLSDNSTEEKNQGRLQNKIRGLATMEATLFFGGKDSYRRDDDGMNIIRNSLGYRLDGYLVKPEEKDTGDWQFDGSQKEKHWQLFEKTASDLLATFSVGRKLIRKIIKQPHFDFYSKELKDKVIGFINAGEYSNFKEPIEGSKEDRKQSYSLFLRKLESLIESGDSIYKELLSQENSAKRDLELDKNGEILLNFQAYYETRGPNKGGLFIINTDGSLAEPSHNSSSNSGTSKTIRRAETELAIGIKLITTNDADYKSGTGVIWNPEKITPEQVKTLKKIETDFGLGTTIEEALSLPVENKIMNEGKIKEMKEIEEMKKEGLLEVWQEVKSTSVAFAIKEGLPLWIEKFGERKLLDAFGAVVREPKISYKIDAFTKSLGLNFSQLLEIRSSLGAYFLDTNSGRNFGESCAGALALLRKGTKK